MPPLTQTDRIVLLLIVAISIAIGAVYKFTIG
jgi:hypothetical protein